MRVLTSKNVCQALHRGVDYLLRCGVREETRAGPALVAPEPVATKTLVPRQRVLFSAVRDANPFFHMYEAIWMLAGRRDSTPLLGFVKGFDTYAEPDGTVHGAYGHRWRENFGIDQLEVVAEKLIASPSDRQAVITMWDPYYSVHGDGTFPGGIIGGNDLCGTWRDRPCNTHVYLRVRDEPVNLVSQNWHGDYEKTGEISSRKVLDITVCCRSNDAIWGAHGANAVHFSVLHEYLAARIGSGVGTMYQLSNNYHAYVNEIDRLTKRAGGEDLCDSLHCDRYFSDRFMPTPMFSAPLYALKDSMIACAAHDRGWAGTPVRFANPWFEETFKNAMLTHLLHKNGDRDAALKWCESIEAPDWRVACSEWLERRGRR